MFNCPAKVAVRGYGLVLFGFFGTAREPMMMSARAFGRWKLGSC